MEIEPTEKLPRDAYADLFARSGATAFQHPVWIEAFERHLAPGRGARVAHLVAREADRLTGAVSLTLRRKNGLRLLEAFDLGVCDYVAPVLDDGVDATAVAERMREALPPHDMLRISNVRPEHAAFWSALCGEEAEPAGFSAHATALRGTFEEWRATSLDRSIAGQTKRKWKRWRRDAAVECERLSAGEAEDAIRDLAALREGRFDGDPIRNDHTRDFYAAVATRGAGGFSEVWRLGADGETAGLLFGVTHAGIFHYLLIGCDYDRFGRHSPGQQLYERVIEDWMARGGTAFDFTIGDEPFKRQYGTQPTPMRRFCAARTLPGKVGRLVLQRRQAA